MERDHGPAAEGAASFHTTRWTIIMRAAQSPAQGGQSALGELCRLYGYPLYIFAQCRGHSPNDAKDLTQGFFLHVVEQRAFASVDRLKGNFDRSCSPHSRTTSPMWMTVPTAIKEKETKNLCSWMQKRPKNAIDSSRSSF